MSKKTAKKTLVGQRELARVLNCSLGKIQHHLNTGAIQYEPNTKKFDPEKARQRIDEFTREKFDEDEARDSKRLDYQKARMMSTLYEAQLKKLELDTKSGKLVDAAKAKSEYYKAGRQLRDRVMALPDHISNVLASMMDAHEIHNYLTKVFNDALQGIADVGKPKN